MRDKKKLAEAGVVNTGGETRIRTGDKRLYEHLPYPWPSRHAGRNGPAEKSWSEATGFEPRDLNANKVRQLR